MKLKLILMLFLVASMACSTLATPSDSSDSASPPQGVPPSETVAAPDTGTAVLTELPNTPATFVGETPQPPTIAAPIVSSPGFTFLHMFPDRLDAWGITEHAILRTNDGGSTWYNVSPQGVTDLGFGTGHTFLNASQAWVMVADTNDPAGSGLLYRTEDGGLNWTVYPVPFGGGDMTFIDETHGWMMAALGAGAGSMAVAIYTTDDGGATWIQVYTNDPNLENAGDSLPLSGIKNNLTPLDAQTAWVGGVIYAPETFYLYKTTDGGKTWAPQTIPTAPEMQNTDIAVDTGPIFTTPSDGILPVRFTGETLRTGFYATHDGGITWEFVAFLPGVGSVDFDSPCCGVFWNGEQFYITADWPNNWQAVSPNVDFADSFAGMDFVDTRDGWVWTFDQSGHPGGLYETTDGGATWVPVKN